VRALRFIYEDYESTYDELLEKAKVPSLKVRRMRTMAIECFMQKCHAKGQKLKLDKMKV
jgi:hypothetical protein